MKKRLTEEQLKEVIQKILKEETSVPEFTNFINKIEQFQSPPSHIKVKLYADGDTDDEQAESKWFNLTEKQFYRIVAVLDLV